MRSAAYIIYEGCGLRNRRFTEDRFACMLTVAEMPLAAEKREPMNVPEYYESDLLRYFEGHPEELTLYEALFARLSAVVPEASVKVQKSQISFYGRHLFAAASLPVRRKRDWPKHCLLVTFGLAQRVEHERIAVAVEPYPNRWTHHVVISSIEELDEQLLTWIKEAYDFSQYK